MKNKKEYDQLNIRISTDLNDWINSVVRQTKRIHGAKIPKEVIVETAIEVLQELELNLEKIKDKESLIKQISTKILDFAQKIATEKIKTEILASGEP